jgi:DUF438 domain-containing protein
MNTQAVKALTDIIKDLHAETSDRAELSRRFSEIAAQVSSVEIAAAEEAAIASGVPEESVRKLCDVHLNMFVDDARRGRAPVAAGHPVGIMYAEHDTLLAAIRSARTVLLPDGPASAAEAVMRAVADLLPVLEGAERNFVKQENAFFPVMEKHGVERPPAIMWSEHDMLRELFTRFAALGPGQMDEAGRILLQAEELLSAHVHKEETILFHAALEMLSDDEWSAIRHDFDELGYLHASVPAFEGDAENEGAESKGVVAAHEATGSGMPRDQVTFPSGSLTAGQLLAVFQTLPVDITVVDANDKVSFFSETPERIFPRARSVVGRSVQNCHPPKSVHIVQEILDSFRAGTRDSEEFYLHLGDKYVHIRYFALHDAEGNYLGCLEVSQDIAPLQAISGEKRIL